MIRLFPPTVDKTVNRSQVYPAQLAQITAVLDGSKAAYKCFWLVNADGRVFSKTRLVAVPFGGVDDDGEFSRMIAALSGLTAPQAEISFGEFDSRINDAHDLTRRLMIEGHSIRVTSLKADDIELLGAECEVRIDDQRSITQYLPLQKGNKQ